MKVVKSELEAVAMFKEQYPQDNLPEISFAGRSNVGKSSFINSVLNRRNLARISNKPGKTRTINFYKLNDQYRLVDLPGYGYAATSHAERDKWAKSINQYLNSRDNLRELILLVDIRHEPTDQDKQMYDWIKQFGFTGYVIATKADKISKGQHQRHISVIRKKLDIDDSNIIIPFSSLSKFNLDKVTDLLEHIYTAE